MSKRAVWRYGGRAVGETGWALRAAVVVLLTALPPYRPTALFSQAQPILVPAAHGFRPRPIQQHQFRYQIAVDTGAGGLVARQVALESFTFGGTLRVDGIAPFAREVERAGYADTARFEPDGRNVLAIADRAARGPIHVEVRGIAGSSAGRLIFSGTGWPANRVLEITIEPLDLYVTATRRGYAVRDRVRIDDTRGVAYVSDTAAAPAVIAIGMGRGARGRLQSGTADVVLERDFGGETGRERRTVNRLVLFVEPDRTDEGVMRAEVVFGLGRSEAEALAAAQGGTSGVPFAPPLPRLTMASSDANLALFHLQGAAAWLPQRPAPAESIAGTGAELWRGVMEEVGRIVQRDYGRPDSASRDAAAFAHRLLRGVFGIERREDRVLIAPRVDGAADNFTWRVDGFRLPGDSLSYAYRPDTRRITVTVGAVRRVRLQFRLPWLASTACAEARRGPDPAERLALVMMDDGSGYVDVRAGFEPVTVTVSAACGS